MPKLYLILIILISFRLLYLNNKKMNKYWKFFLLFLLVLLIFIFQFSFLNSLSGFFSKINLFLLISVCLFIFYDFRVSLSFALVSGFVLDIFSFYPFGIYFISFLIILVVADIIWNNFFTNRSIYSFLFLGFLMVFFYNFFLYFLMYIFSSYEIGILWFNKTFFFNLLLELIWVLSSILLLFYSLNPQKRRFSGLSFDKK